MQTADVMRIQREHPEALALGRHRSHIREHMSQLVYKMGSAEPEQMRSLFNELCVAMAELERHVEMVEELWRMKR